MFFKHVLTTVPFIPATPAQIPLYLPRGLWMIKKSTQLAVARRAEIHPSVVFNVFVRMAGLADEQARIHLPLPLWLISVLVLSNHFATYRAEFRSILPRIIYLQEFLCLVDMAVGTKQP